MDTNRTTKNNNDDENNTNYALVRLIFGFGGLLCAFRVYSIDTHKARRILHFNWKVIYITKSITKFFIKIFKKRRPLHSSLQK